MLQIHLSVDQLRREALAILQDLADLITSTASLAHELVDLLLDRVGDRTCCLLQVAVVVSSLLLSFLFNLSFDELVVDLRHDFAEDFGFLCPALLLPSYLPTPLSLLSDLRHQAL